MSDKELFSDDYPNWIKHKVKQLPNGDWVSMPLKEYERLLKIEQGTGKSKIAIEYAKKLEEATKKERERTKEKLNSKEFLEELSELEHKEWEYWSKNVTSQLMDDTLSPEVIGQRMLKKHQSWLNYWVDYDELDEKIKEEDRKWARKVVKIVEKQLKNQEGK